MFNLSATVYPYVAVYPCVVAHLRVRLRLRFRRGGGGGPGLRQQLGQGGEGAARVVGGVGARAVDADGRQRAEMLRLPLQVELVVLPRATKVVSRGWPNLAERRRLPLSLSI